VGGRAAGILGELGLSFPPSRRAESTMALQLRIVYWKSGKFWLGKLVDHPEIMTQGETLEELEENLKDAYRTLVLEDVPAEYETKEISV
jgi:predicted RNase H-like HicB family nuclease